MRYSDEHRHYVSLYRDTDVEVWLICWTPASDTGWHDHDTSAGAVAVAEGAVVEHNLAVGAPELVTVATEGTAYSFGPDHIHRMTGRRRASPRPIHAYSPPLWRMGQYTISRERRAAPPVGLLRRRAPPDLRVVRPRCARATSPVEPRGLEPLTPCLQSRCATNCAKAPRWCS